MTEAQLVNQTIRLLTSRGILAFGRYSSTIKGLADVLGYLPDGRFIAIECKPPGESLTPAQTDFLAAVRRRGGVAAVVYCLLAVCGGFPVPFDQETPIGELKAHSGGDARRVFLAR